MKRPKVNVLVLRQNPKKMPKELKQAIKACFPEYRVKFRRVDPVNYRQHLKICLRYLPVAVVLPKERPIPAAAMERGFQHIIVGDDGKILELLPLQPQFKEFVYAPRS